MITLQMTVMMYATRLQLELIVTSIAVVVLLEHLVKRTLVVMMHLS